MKPHPSNNLSELKCVLNETKNNHWKITTGPIYKLSPEIDFCISLYSTVFFVPSAMGIPVILLNTSKQEIVNKDVYLRKLYDGFSFYLDDNALFESTLKEVLKIASKDSRQESPVTSDIDHIRHYYPDGAIERAINQLRIPSSDIKASR